MELSHRDQLTRGITHELAGIYDFFPYILAI